MSLASGLPTAHREILQVFPDERISALMVGTAEVLLLSRRIFCERILEIRRVYSEIIIVTEAQKGQDHSSIHIIPQLEYWQMLRDAIDAALEFDAGDGVYS